MHTINISSSTFVLRTDQECRARENVYTSIRLFRAELYGSYRMHNYLFYCLAKHLINQFFMCFVFVTSAASTTAPQSKTDKNEKKVSYKATKFCAKRL